MADEGTWDEARLMGKGIEGGGADAAKADPMLWGIPGYLTQEEADAYVSAIKLLDDATVCVNVCRFLITLYST